MNGRVYVDEIYDKPEWLIGTDVTPNVASGHAGNFEPGLKPGFMYKVSLKNAQEVTIVRIDRNKLILPKKTTTNVFCFHLSKDLRRDPYLMDNVPLMESKHQNTSEIWCYLQTIMMKPVAFAQFTISNM